MATPTYVPLATQTLGSTATSVTFSSIPATYRDLVLIFDVKMGSTSAIRLRLNGDTGSNYSNVSMFNTSSASGTANRITPGVSGDTSFWGTLAFMDYSATDKHTTMLARTNNLASVVANAIRWQNTDAVNTIECFVEASSFSIGSTLSLYGIA